jgi:hypothetical protein
MTHELSGEAAFEWARVAGGGAACPTVPSVDRNAETNYEDKLSPCDWRHDPFRTSFAGPIISQPRVVERTGIWLLLLGLPAGDLSRGHRARAMGSYRRKHVWGQIFFTGPMISQAAIPFWRPQANPSIKL